MSLALTSQAKSLAFVYDSISCYVVLDTLIMAGGLTQRAVKCYSVYLLALSYCPSCIFSVTKTFADGFRAKLLAVAVKVLSLANTLVAWTTSLH